MATKDTNHRPASLDLNLSKTAVILKTAMKNVHFKNWSETFECYPELFFAPKTEEELKDILALAREMNKTVRVVGCKHSPSDIACTTGTMISMQYFDKILEVNKSKLQVKVQSGVVISDLNHILFSHNLALSVLGSISDITIGGAISVATHGSGINYGTLSSYVSEMDLMLSDGSVISLSPENSPDLFLTAVCGLGSCGIVLNVTMQCEPAYNLQLRQYGLNLKDIIENLDVHIEGSDHFKFLWYPHTDGVVVSHCSRTSLDPPKETWIRKIWNWFWDYGIGYYSLEFCLYVSTFFPHLVPSINRLYYNILFSGSKTKIDRSYKIFNYDCLFKQYVNEWAIPIKNTGLVLWRLREWIESTPDTYVHFPVEVRFAKAEQIFLSPTYGQNMCYMNIIMYRPYGKDVPYKNYWAAYEKIMLEAEGRPHWAKAHSVTAKMFDVMYPCFGKWCALRQKLDPINMFLNPYILRIFNQ